MTFWLFPLFILKYANSLTILFTSNVILHQIFYHSAIIELLIMILLTVLYHPFIYKLHWSLKTIVHTQQLPTRGPRTTGGCEL